MRTNGNHAGRVIAALLAGSVAACGAVGEQATQNFADSVEVSGPLELDVQTVGGSICVRQGAPGRAVVTARVRVNADTAELAQETADRIAKDPPISWRQGQLELGDLDSFGFDAEHEGWIFEVSIDFKVEVPPGTDVRSTNVSGHTCIEDIDGTVTVDSVSGDVELRGLRGAATVRTVSGDVTVEQASAVDVETTSGDLDAAEVTGKLRYETVSGRFTGAALDDDLSLESVSGDVVLSSSLAASATWEIRSVSGDLELTLPAEESFHFEVESLSGEFDNDFASTTRHHERNLITGEVGDAPDALISTETTSGDLRLRRQHPATP